jgi:hypothetical protein
VAAAASLQDDRVVLPDEVKVPVAGLAITLLLSAMKKMSKGALCVELKARGVAYAKLNKAECLGLLQRSLYLLVDCTK